MNIDNIFQTEVFVLGLDSVGANIEDIPDKKQIYLRIYNIIKFKSSLQNIFKLNFKLVSKKPFINLLNFDLNKLIEEYIFDVTDLNYNKIYKSIYKNYIQKINDIIEENKFDLNWYEIGTKDSQWAITTINNANKLKNRLGKILN